MKSLRLLCLGVFLAFLGCKTVSQKAPAENFPVQAPSHEISSEKAFSYIIGAGDVLRINVWRHPDLKEDVKVQPDGKISFPIVHSVKAGGLTPEELEHILARGLSRVLKEPDVSIAVMEYQSQKFFILGEVQRPGVYPLIGDTHVIDAVSFAGGFMDTAASSSVLLIRDGRAQRMNLSDLLRKARMTENIELRSRDIIFVPKSFISEVDKFIDQFFTRTDPVLKYWLDVLDIDDHEDSVRVR